MSEPATNDEAGAPFRPYSWRHAFMKAQLPPTAKLILHTIAAHFGEAGEPAYPKIVTIARRASLSERAVKKHLGPIIGVWVHVERVPFKDNSTGRTYTRYNYLPRYPEGLIDFDLNDSPGAPRARAPRAPAQNKEPIKKNKISPNPISGEMGDWFEKIFEAYPNKQAKDRAWRKVQHMAPDAALRDEITEGLARWRRYADLKSAPFLSTWLRNGTWREARTKRIPGLCSACGNVAVVGDGRDYWCRAHDPDRRPA